MDHHCPWVMNCIGFHNYKYFINMLFYTTSTIWLIVVTSSPLVQQVLNCESVNYKVAYYILTSYMLAITLGFVITCFFAFHIWLILTQYTTIEFCEKRSDGDSNFRTSPYNVGWFRNLQIVLGNNVLTWIFPCCKNSLLTFRAQLEGRRTHLRSQDGPQTTNRL